MTNILEKVQELLKQYEPSAEDIASVKKAINAYSQALKRSKTKPGAKQSRKKTYDTKKCWSKLENGSQCKRKPVSGNHFCRKHVHNSTEYGWITDTDASNNNVVIIGNITPVAESENRCENGDNNFTMVQTRSKTKKLELTDAKKTKEVKNENNEKLSVDVEAEPNVNINNVNTKSSEEAETNVNTNENTEEIINEETNNNDNNIDEKKEGMKTRAQCKQAIKKTAYYIREINGIHYFVDEKNNVYKTESILDEYAVAEIIGTIEEFEYPEKLGSNVEAGAEVKVKAEIKEEAKAEIKEEANVIEDNMKNEKKNTKNIKTNTNKKQKRTRTNTKSKSKSKK